MQYTEEQITRANQTNLVSFLNAQGEQLVKSGREYRWKKHDSVTVGIKTVSGFLAEAGDIRRFNDPKELQKLAGLALVENSSGKHKGKTTISRRGRKRLRYLLFEVAMSLVAKNPEFRELHNYYTTRRLNPLKKMQSLMVIAAKLLRVFYAILTKGVGYDPKKMVNDIRRPAAYAQAA